MSIIASSVKAHGRKFLNAVNQMGTAEVRAQNLVARGVRTEADRAIRERLALPQKFVLPQIKVIKAKEEANPKFIIETREKGMPYRVQNHGSPKPHYKATQLRTGMKLKTFKSGTKKRPNQFAVRVKGQGRKAEGQYARRYGGRVFMRTSREGKRLPIKLLWGPSIYAYRKKAYVNDRMDKRYAKDLPGYLRQQEDFVLRKVKIL